MPQIGSEYLTSNRHSIYPFAEDSRQLFYQNDLNAWDKVYSSALYCGVPTDFLLDLSIITDESVVAAFLTGVNCVDGVITLQMRATVTSTFVSTGTVSIDWEFVLDDTLADIMTHISTHRYYIVAQSTDLTWSQSGIPPWQHAGHPFTFRAVVDHGFTDALQEIQSRGPLTLAGFLPLRFAARTMQNMPPDVRSLKLYAGDMTLKHASVIDGHVQLIPGYNIVLEAEPGQDGDTTDVTMAAVPGAGEGLVPCDELPANEISQSAMSLSPDATGALRFVGDSCYSIVPSRATNQVMIQGSCYACCSCEDYMAVARALQLILQRTHDARLALEQLHTRYDLALGDYRARHYPELRRGYLEVQAFKGVAPGSDKHGNMTVKLVNKGDSNMTSVSVSLEPRTGTLVHGSYRIGASAVSVQCGLVISGKLIPTGHSLVAVYRFKAEELEQLSSVLVSVAYVLNGHTYTDSSEAYF